jgi:hypothetical protein
LQVLGRLLRVDHVQTYKLPKNLEKLDEERKKLLLEGCAPKPIEEESEPEDLEDVKVKDEDVKKKHKKKKKKRLFKLLEKNHFLELFLSIGQADP